MSIGDLCFVHFAAETMGRMMRAAEKKRAGWKVRNLDYPHIKLDLFWRRVWNVDQAQTLRFTFACRQALE